MSKYPHLTRLLEHAYDVSVRRSHRPVATKTTVRMELTQSL